MPAPKNLFKAALAARQAQVGMWLGLASSYTAEIAGGAGFDWLLLDGEHGPNHVQTLLTQLQALGRSPSHPVVRLPVGEAWIIKQMLDIGAQTLLIPMVESAAQAEALVRACRYPPDGMRGVGAALARASDFNRIPDYLTTANAEICLLVQVENARGLAAIEEIAAVPGIDGIFIGPADLAADLGYLGRPMAPEMLEVVESGLKRIMAAGKPAGILTADAGLAQRYLDMGAGFVAVGTDVSLFSQATSRLAAQFGRGAGMPAKPSVY